MDVLRGYIDEKGLKEGDRLPPERELAEELGVARSAIRRMLSALEAEGRLVRQVGRGTFLGEVQAAPRGIEAGTLKTYPAEVLEMRLMLEPQAAALAARRASPVDIEEIAKAAARGGGATSFEEFERWDALFHKFVVTAARNGLLTALYESIDAARSERIWGQLKRASVTPERRRSYQHSHALIAGAIGDRDAGLAEREMRRHLMEVSANMLDS